MVLLPEVGWTLSEELSGQGTQEGRDVCVRVRLGEGERRGKEVASPPVPVWGSNLGLEPVVTTPMHKGWTGCFCFSRKHVWAGLWVMAARCSCFMPDITIWTEWKFIAYTLLFWSFSEEAIGNVNRAALASNDIHSKLPNKLFKQMFV